MFARGNDLLLEGKYAEALSAFGTFVKENPDHRLIPAATWTMANIYLTIEKNYEKAADLFQNMLDEYEDTEWESFGYDRLGSCFEAEENWSQAADVYKTATKKLQIFSDDPETQARNREIKGKALLCYQNLNDYDSIIAMYKENLADNPATSTAPEDQFNLAQTYVTLENPKKAAENFALVVERYPASSFAQRVHTEQVDLLTSELGYDWALYSTFQSAQELGRTGKYDEALDKFEEVMNADPQSGLAIGASIQKQIIDYRMTGEVAPIMEILNADRDTNPYGPGGVPVDRWNNLLRMITNAQQTIETNPDDTGQYIRMSLGYYQTGAYHPGVEVLKKAIAIAPNTPNACNMLGYCYLGVQEYDEAINAFRQLIEIAPDDPNSYDSMAEGCYLKGDTTMAIEFYQKSLATDSSFSNPHYQLGRIFQEQGLKDKAIGHLEKYLEMNADGFQAQNAQRMLEQLKPSPSDANEE